MVAAAIKSRLRLVLNTWTICNLPEFSAFPANMDATDRVGFIKEAGYEGLQMEAEDPLVPAGLAAGMHMSATGRIVSADKAVSLCQSHEDMGFSLTTLHVGTGFETQVEGFRLMEAVLEGAAQTSYPLLVETSGNAYPGPSAYARFPGYLSRALSQRGFLPLVCRL